MEPALSRREAVVFGASAGGIVALPVALRHSEAVGRFQSSSRGQFRELSGGEDWQRPVYR
jgi:enterochelin esterase-like enzyme